MASPRASIRARCVGRAGIGTMTKYCESCRSPNRDRAAYCQGCGGKFSGIVSGASETIHAPGREQAPPAQRRDMLPAVSAREGIVLAMLLAAFAFWYWNRPAASSRHEAAPVAAAVPARDEPVRHVPLAAAAPQQQLQQQAQEPPQQDATPAAPAAKPSAAPPEPVTSEAARAASPPPPTLQIRTPRWTPPPPQPFVPAVTDALPPAVPPARVAAPAPRRGSSACDGDDPSVQALCVPSTRSGQAAAAPIAVVPVEAAAPAGSGGAAASGTQTRRVIVFKGEPIVVNIGDPDAAPGR